MAAYTSISFGNMSHDDALLGYAAADAPWLQGHAFSQPRSASLSLAMPQHDQWWQGSHAPPFDGTVAPADLSLASPSSPASLGAKGTAKPHAKANADNKTDTGRWVLAGGSQSVDVPDEDGLAGCLVWDPSKGTQTPCFFDGRTEEQKKKDDLEAARKAARKAAREAAQKQSKRHKSNAVAKSQTKTTCASGKNSRSRSTRSKRKA